MIYTFGRFPWLIMTHVHSLHSHWPGPSCGWPTAEFRDYCGCSEGCDWWDTSEIRLVCTFPVDTRCSCWAERNTTRGAGDETEREGGDFFSLRKCLNFGHICWNAHWCLKTTTYDNHKTWILKFTWNDWQFPAPFIHSELAKANLYNAMSFRHLCSTHTWQDIPLIGLRTEAR